MLGNTSKEGPQQQSVGGFQANHTIRVGGSHTNPNHTIRLRGSNAKHTLSIGQSIVSILQSTAWRWPKG
eukprot:3736331-Amphidinium_carterae.1